MHACVCECVFVHVACVFVHVACVHVYVSVKSSPCAMFIINLPLIVHIDECLAG